MKFSVLLPTRNGGPFLANCIRSVLNQDYSDLEIVISDNANTDSTPAVIASFAADPRVKILRLEQTMPVTDNWNNALAAASGDYLLMLGDDDLVLPGYFSRMERVLENYGQPECVLYNAYTYVAPDSVGAHSHSYYRERHFGLGPDFAGEGALSPERRRAIVLDMFRFRARIPLNIQMMLVARRAVPGVRGGLFQPPFPDHCAINSLLLTAAAWVYVPKRLVVVGVSPKSFAHYAYSHLAASGLSYLGIEADFPGRLPGNEMLNGMHVWLELLLTRYPDLLAGVHIDRAAYVRRQVYAWIMQRRARAISWSEFVANLRQLSFSDWADLPATILDDEFWRRVLHILRSIGKSQAEAVWRGLVPLEGVADIAQFARWLRDNGKLD